MRPSSVFIPIAATTPRPLPATVLVPMNAMFTRSAIAASLANCGRASFSTGVIRRSTRLPASLARRSLPGARRPERGRLLPVQRRLREPVPLPRCRATSRREYFGRGRRKFPQR